MYNECLNTTFVGKKVEYLPSCRSTDEIGTDKVRNLVWEHGEIIITDCQTKGRGQRGKQWNTLPGKNLTFSILLDTSFLAIPNQFLISQTIGLGVFDFLQLYTNDVALKWPNDVLIGEKKIAGISIENFVRGTSFKATVVGIGININQTEFEFAHVTSLGLATNQSYKLSNLLEPLAQCIEKRWMQLEAGAYDAIRANYLHVLKGRNEERVYQTQGGEIIKAVLNDVNTAGQMQLKTMEGERWFSLQEITWQWL